MDIDKKINKSIKFLQKYTKNTLVLFMYSFYIVRLNIKLNLIYQKQLK